MSAAKPMLLGLTVHEKTDFWHCGRRKFSETAMRVVLREMEKECEAEAQD